jgi:DNA-binding XRE family transcriptional regulator
VIILAFNELVKQHRLKLGIDKKEAARRIGVNIRTYYRYETNDYTKPFFSKICKLCDTLEIDIEEVKNVLQHHNNQLKMSKNA